MVILKPVRLNFKKGGFSHGNEKANCGSSVPRFDVGGGAWADVEINETTFPDENFRAYVSSYIDSNGNGVLSDDEIAAVTTIEVQGAGISSLQGVEYFKALTSLYCSNNRLASLDVSKNTNLEYLNCSSNYRSYYDDNYNYVRTALMSLDVSTNKALKSLNCSDNLLTSLDVSGCTSLDSLSCESNQLTTLDLSKNTELYRLYCSGNKLTTLDVSKNTGLYELSCGSNQLTALDLSKNTELYRLYCGSNQLTALDVSKNTKLWDLSCYSNKLTTLDVSKNTGLYDLSCGDNQLTTLDVSGCTSLDYLGCDSNQLTTLDLSKNTKLYGLYCSSNPLMTLDVSSNTELRYLSCSGNRLTTLDLSKNTSLDSLTCIVNQLTTLDLSSNTELHSLSCGSNRLTSLDVSKNTKLTYLDCSDNQLTTLDVSKSTELYRLECDHNQLAALDVSSNTKLEYLYCQSNRLPALDLSKNTSLSLLRCYAQSVSPLRITETGNSSYPYQLNFGDYITASGALAKVSDVQGIDSNDAKVSLTYANGIALFASRPVRVSYYYDTDSDVSSFYSSSSEYRSSKMDVTISDNPTQTPSADDKPSTPESLTTEALANIGRSLGSGSSSVSYIPESDMSAVQTPTSEITREVSSKGYQIVANQGSLNISRSGSYAFPISVPYHFVGTKTAAKVYLARRSPLVGMVMTPSADEEDLIEAQIFTEAGEEVTTLPSTIIAAANIEVSAPTTFSTHLATKVESSGENRGTSSSSGGCNSGFAFVGLALVGLFRKKSK